MAIIKLPASLCHLCNVSETLTLKHQQSLTSIALMQMLVTQHPALKKYLFDYNGNINCFLNIYVNGKDTRALLPDYQIHEQDQIDIITALSGG